MTSSVVLTVVIDKLAWLLSEMMLLMMGMTFIKPAPSGKPMTSDVSGVMATNVVFVNDSLAAKWRNHVAAVNDGVAGEAETGIEIGTNVKPMAWQVILSD